ncbi:unnamed protein product [Chilo suppressalis]|uniref:Uncharacterized protein n=1 Tax=Chilo suppressalis TaxID=168631 RepID=A0ABN8L8G3_CHISP|nr:unnamed protein product [Chilo suppressalis]
MSSCSSQETDTTQAPIKELYQRTISTSSSEPPMEQWSSLFEIEAPDAPKMVLFKQGLYDPGSGEICAKYIPLSDSSVFRHVYYAYPAIKDPGIEGALLQPEKRKIYPRDGQELYLDLCKEMNIVPVRIFYRGLLERNIDLKYYCVNPVGVRAMSLALLRNTAVKHLDLTSNFLNEDACYHLGQLLGENVTLQELVLSSCKIEPVCLKRLVCRLPGRSMDLLDLSKNGIGDQGFFYLTEQIIKGAVIKRLSLSNNELGPESALALCEAIEGNNKFTHLDLSWNKLFPPKGIGDLLRMLGDNNVLEELNLSWNGLTVAQPLRRVLAIPTLKVLDLSNNRLSSASTRVICSSLRLAQKLVTLDLSNNPLTSNDALLLLEKMKESDVVVLNLFMDNITVNKEFAMMLPEVLSLPHRKAVKITYGKVIHDYTLSVPDLREIVMRRLFYITDSSKRCTMDMPWNTACSLLLNRKMRMVGVAVYTAVPAIFALRLHHHLTSVSIS